MRWVLWFSLFVAIFFTIQAKQLTFRPLSATEVYQLLANTGRSDALPEGRIVTQGLTFINNLTRRLTGRGSETRITTQEVCFNTRSARNLAEAEAVYGAYVAASNRHLRKPQPRPVRKSEVGRVLKLKKRKKLRYDDERRDNNRIKNQDDGPISLPGLLARAAAATSAYSSDMITSDPEAIAELTETGDSLVNRKANDDAMSSSTTSTWPEDAINCIVIKKS